MAINEGTLGKNTVLYTPKTDSLTAQHAKRIPHRDVHGRNKLSKPKLNTGTGMSSPTLVLCSGTPFDCLCNAVHAVRYLRHSRPLVWFSIPAVLHDLDQLHAHTLHSQHDEAHTYVTRLQSSTEAISHIKIETWQAQDIEQNNMTMDAATGRC